MKKVVLLTMLFIMLYASSALAMITRSRHNLSSSHTEITETPAYADVFTSNTSEVCVFCHTPHGGQTAAPLWNRNLPTTGSYTPYTSTTMDATTGQPGGISLACLSCHDGTIALDAITNAPGSGGYDPTRTSMGWSFTGLTGTQSTGGANSLPESGGSVTGRWITNLTQDLSNDHPISMTYPIAPGGTIIGSGDPKFNAPTGGTTTARWFEEGAANSRADDNEIKLYPTGTDFRVECASCHNPHGTTATGTNPPDQVTTYGDYVVFLRKSNNASGVCTTCHIK